MPKGQRGRERNASTTDITREKREHTLDDRHFRLRKAASSLTSKPQEIIDQRSTMERVTVSGQRSQCRDKLKREEPRSAATIDLSRPSLIRNLIDW